MTFRIGPHVERRRADSLEEAVDLLEERVRAAAGGPGLDSIDMRLKRYEPGDLVAARGEVTGPQRLRPDVRAGLDVRGDGTVQAWTVGGTTREAVEPADGEDAYAALRRALTA
jgi:hypothetical protein